MSSTNNSILVDSVVDIIASYLHLGARGDQFLVSGRSSLIKTVSTFISSSQPIELIFPGFPFKSPSPTKVLSSLPDLGEELLLKRLDSLATDITKVYEAGAVVRVVSDGVVYGSLLGVKEREVWKYGEGLRGMKRKCGLDRLEFVRVCDLLDSNPVSTPGAQSLDTPPSSSDSDSESWMTEEAYLLSLSDIRGRFLAHEVQGYDLDDALKNDSGTLWTYRGYLKFLESDLEGSEVMRGVVSGNAKDKKRRIIAKAMLRNGARFSDLVARKFPDAVRLSVHAHNNAGPKFAFDLFPGRDMSASPVRRYCLLSILYDPLPIPLPASSSRRSPFSFHTPRPYDDIFRTNHPASFTSYLYARSDTHSSFLPRR
ncbi:Pyoverdine/dityrosine biosynthesis protein-domain-containing protein [Pterulicium gracile]|uniref:Pyoverdine/dityrosine biosynthesis protein-domain-containing protein n=1 Tax=Pterulicium gracile TaxID=1884261 RepID=A0A5C3Q309_9AGAR|nr:Pyoverdine/dityrosine biosynthesis protein-domain-containing protein [Pterula gracilis]